MSPVRMKQCAGPCGQSKLLDEFWRDSKQPDGRQTRCIVCVKAGREERQERRRNGENLPVFSDEERRRRSERMTKLHEEGRAGGAAFGALGGRPRKPRISDAILDDFREKTPLVIRAIESNLRSKNQGHRMRAVEFLARLEETEDKRLREARGSGKAPEEMTDDELAEFVAQALAARFASGELEVASDGTITLGDSEVREVPVEQVAA